MGAQIEVLMPPLDVTDAWTRAWYVDGGSNQGYGPGPDGGTYAPNALPHQIGTDTTYPANPTTPAPYCTVGGYNSGARADGTTPRYVKISDPGAYSQQLNMACLSLPATPVTNFLFATWYYADDTGSIPAAKFADNNGGDVVEIIWSSALNGAQQPHVDINLKKQTGGVFILQASIYPTGLTGFAFTTSFHSLMVSVDTVGQNIWVYADNVRWNGAGSTITWQNTPSAGMTLPRATPWGLSWSSTNNNARNNFFGQTRFGAGEGVYDLTVAANRQRIVSATNGSVSWGAAGSTITGQIPPWYLDGPAAQFLTGCGVDGPATLTTVSGPAGSITDVSGP